ncbi:hypothetical protein [Actinoplanes sp. NPDC049599]|uniref:hypothetical protein n=1 Tax=Actinoplanes sp. NPDC049599 TaxID=3363903 RepID=UPI0037A0EC61
MSSSDQHDDATPARRASAPGSVQAAAILLYVGGALSVLFALTGLMSASAGGLRLAVYGLLGLLYLGLARAVQMGRRWARRLLLVLCAIGIAAAGLSLAWSSPSAAVGALAWPVVYATLLNTGPARAWFHRPDA